MKRVLLRWLRVPERPSPPLGAGSGVRLFHPSRRFLLRSWVRWGVSQASGLVGILFTLAALGRLPVPEAISWFDFLGTVNEELDLDRRVGLDLPFFSLETDVGLLELITWIEIVAIGGFLLQFLFSGMMVKLRWETHWYMVSDRVLGIRKGVFSIREQTMTVANVQNMKIQQGPLQRLFGYSDLVVHTAGGSGGGSDDPTKESDLHVGRFEGLEDAEGLRRTIRRSLALHRSSGLGDPDEDEQEHHEPQPSLAEPSSPETALAEAAAGLAGEARRARVAAEEALARLGPGAARA